MSVTEILSAKSDPRTVHTIGCAATVIDATKLMNQKKIGALPVVNDKGRVAGMFTERDVLRRVVAQQRDPLTTRVRDVMTSPVAVCTVEHGIDEVRSMMRNKRIRHLPVVDGEQRLIGMISIGDLNAYLLRNGQIENQYMHEYIHGRC